MKILSLLLAFVLCFLAVIPVSATEIPQPDVRYIGDADDDGKITAADARYILRAAVGLEYTDGSGLMDWTDIIYSDYDENAELTAADARYALRAAVGLEELKAYAYTFTFSEEPRCVYGLTITAECAVTGKKLVIKTEPYEHDLNPYEWCAGTGVCYMCEQTVTVEPRHNFKVNLCTGVKHCDRCDHKEYFKEEHDYIRGMSCSRCSKDLRYPFSDFVNDFMMENPEYVYRAPDGSFSAYIETNGPVLFAFICNGSHLINGLCEMSLEIEGETYTFSAFLDFSKLKMEVECYQDENLVAFCKTEVYTDLLGTSATGKGIGIIHYESSIPELQSQKEDFRILSDSLATSLFAWFKAFATVNGFEYADEMLSENPMFR